MSSIGQDALVARNQCSCLTLVSIHLEQQVVIRTLMSRLLGSKAPWHVIDLERLGDMVDPLTWNQVLKLDDPPRAQ
jgi:hypothetical protein